MENIAAEHFPNSVDPGNNKAKSWFHSYITYDNE